MSWGDTGLVVKSLIKQQYREGNNQACINLEGANSFQPIRIELCPHVTKTKKKQGVMRLPSGRIVFKLSLLLTKKYFMCETLE